MKIFRCLLSFGLLSGLLLLSSLAFGQTLTTADLTGTVTDTTGAVVPGVVVTLRFVDTNETRTAATNEQGQYRFELLQPGNYTLSAERGALKTAVQKFTLLLGQEQTVNLTMQVQGTQQVVQVTAETAMVQTENANRDDFLEHSASDRPACAGR